MDGIGIQLLCASTYPVSRNQYASRNFFGPWTKLHIDKAISTRALSGEEEPSKRLMPICYAPRSKNEAGSSKKANPAPKDDVPRLCTPLLLLLSGNNHLETNTIP